MQIPAPPAWLMIGIVAAALIFLAIQAARSGGSDTRENGGPIGDAVGASSPRSPTPGGGAP